MQAHIGTSLSKKMYINVHLNIYKEPNGIMSATSKRIWIIFYLDLKIEELRPVHR